jgi:phage-related protein
MTIYLGGSFGRPARDSGKGPAERCDAFRVIYAVQFGEEVWVLHAFQKKSTRGVKTPQREIDVIKDRLKRLKEMLR